MGQNYLPPRETIRVDGQWGETGGLGANILPRRTYDTLVGAKTFVVTPWELYVLTLSLPCSESLCALYIKIYVFSLTCATVFLFVTLNSLRSFAKKIAQFLYDRFSRQSFDIISKRLLAISLEIKTRSVVSVFKLRFVGLSTQFNSVFS